MKTPKKPHAGKGSNPKSKENLRPREPDENKERIFVEEYLRTKNASKSAIAAGYSPNGAGTTGYQLLHKPSIARQINAAMQAALLPKTQLKNAILRKLQDSALASPMEIFREGSRIIINQTTGQEHEIETLVLLPEESWSDQARNAIEAVEVSPQGAVKVKFNDPIKAMEKLKEYINLWDQAEEQVKEHDENKAFEEMGEEFGDNFSFED